MLRNMTYCENDKHFLHRIHPLAKSLFLILFLIAALSEMPWYNPLLLIIFLSIVSLLSRINLIFFLLKAKFILFTGFSILLLQVYVHPEGTMLFFLIPAFIPYIGESLPVTNIGLTIGFNLLGRFIAIIASSFIFVQTTEPNKFAVAFQQLKVPYRYSYSIILALRFIPLFNLEKSQITNAMAVRGIEFEKKLPLSSSIKIIKFTFIPLIVSTLNKSEDLAISMQLRGFGAFKKRTYYKTLEFSMIDLYTIIIGIAIIFIIYFL